jgi:hypothetical protein
MLPFYANILYAILLLTDPNKAIHYRKICMRHPLSKNKPHGMLWLHLLIFRQDLFTASSRSNFALYSPRQGSFAEQLYLIIKIAKQTLEKVTCFDKSKQYVIRDKVRITFKMYC